MLDAAVQAELETRILSLSEKNTAQWGKMNLSQMVQHCIAGDHMYQGKINPKRSLIGRLIGGSILNKILKNDLLFNKNSPTAPELKVNNSAVDLEAKKQEWLQTVKAYPTLEVKNFVHPFFGAMSKEQIGHMAYKHADHHLRQFGAW